jgi:hypothetical protein
VFDLNALAEHSITAVGSGITSFFGAYLRFQQRLKKVEDSVTALKGKYENLKSGWKLEFDGFRQDFANYKEMRDGIEEARKEERTSYADPFETMNTSIARLQADIEKLRERSGRYVRNDTFAAFARSQEEQWRQINRTLGQLEGALKE